jgi:hypothetical protein
MMLDKILRAFVLIMNRDRIPPLPRGMLASDYTALTSEERRVIARFGARDPNGVRIALKRAGVKTVDELVDQLDHYAPERRIAHRLNVGLGRLMGGFDRDPHRDQIVRETKRKTSKQQKDIEERVKRARKVFKESEES